MTGQAEGRSQAVPDRQLRGDVQHGSHCSSLRKLLPKQAGTLESISDQLQLKHTLQYTRPALLKTVKGTENRPSGKLLQPTGSCGDTVTKDNVT